MIFGICNFERLCDMHNPITNNQSRDLTKIKSVNNLKNLSSFYIVWYSHSNLFPFPKSTVREPCANPVKVFIEGEITALIM